MRYQIRRANFTCIKGIVFWCGLLICLIINPGHLLAQTDITLKPGDRYPGFIFPVNGCNYTWVNDDPSIGLKGTDVGDIPAFIAKNPTNQILTSTITINSTAKQAYGYLMGDQMTGIYNLNSNRLENSLPTRNTAAAAYGFSRDGSLLYVFNANISGIDVVNTVTNTVAYSIPVDFSRNLIVNPNGKYLYMANNARKVSVVELGSVNNEVAVIDVGPGANAPLLAISPDGSTLYAAKNNNIFFIDTQTNAIIKTVSPALISTLTVTPDGRQVIASGERFVYVIDVLTGNIRYIPVGASLLGSPVMQPNGSEVYFTDGAITNSGQKIYAVNLISGAVNTIQVSQKFFYLTLNDNGSILYATEESTGTTYVIDTSTKQITATININAAGPGETTVSHGSIRHGGNEFYITSLVSGANGSRSSVTVVNAINNIVVQRVDLPILATLLVTGTAEVFCNTPPRRFTITVEAKPPVINVSGTPLRLTTTYGTPSSATTFSISGSSVSAGIAVAAPFGFEVSADGINFTSLVRIGGAEVVSPTTIYIRLKATVPVNTYGGSIVVSSGNTVVNYAMTLSEVFKTPLSISASDIHKIYGETLVSGSGKTDFTAEGLKNGETIGSVTASYGAGSASTDPVSVYSGSVSVSDPVGGTFKLTNYLQGVSGAGAIIIDPAPLTIKPDDKQRFFGDNNAPLTVTYIGFVNNETQTVLATLPTVTTSATAVSPVGTYPITAAGAAAANYQISYSPGVLNVLPRLITPPNTFTPNGDGVNDTWVIPAINQYPQCTIEIVNRFGTKVYQSLGYAFAWDGTSQGKKLPGGTYYYIIRLNAGDKPLAGKLTIIR